MSDQPLTHSVDTATEGYFTRINIGAVYIHLYVGLLPFRVFWLKDESVGPHPQCVPADDWADLQLRSTYSCLVLDVSGVYDGFPQMAVWYYDA